MNRNILRNQREPPLNLVVFVFGDSSKQYLYSNVAYKLDDIVSAVGISKVITTDITLIDSIVEDWAIFYNVELESVSVNVGRYGKDSLNVAYDKILNKKPDLFLGCNVKEDSELIKKARKESIPVLLIDDYITITKSNIYENMGYKLNA